MISSLVLDVSSVISFLILRRPSQQWRCMDIRKLFFYQNYKKNMEGWFSRPHYNFREARWLSGIYFGLRIRRSHSRSCQGWLAPRSSLIIWKRSKNGRGRLLRNLVRRRGTMGRGKGKGRDSPFPFPSSPALPWPRISCLLIGDWETTRDKSAARAGFVCFFYNSYKVILNVFYFSL